MVTHYQIDYPSSIGIIEISGTSQAITAIIFTEKKRPDSPSHVKLPQVIKNCCTQLDEYFAGQRQKFSIPYILEGTDFQKEVWQFLTTIPYGETRSYQDIAVSLNREKATRAVGHANGKNKLNMIIPCHRLIGTNGNLTGYAGGIWRKKWLLEHEKKHAT
ncbi:methylated-DNA--[protein]-cysteine S-methyltransferase [Lentibacillus sp. N15]|uniref:methylated-DNA--[protein]-cysteine S-methyltransferase n=1 Tax=Lentibacillus songyuanensis TaxID=3136161 RepID=UPI0031BBC3BB